MTQQVMCGPAIAANPLITSRSIDAIRIGVGTVTASYTISNTGNAVGAVNPGGFGAGNYAPEWAQGATVADYEVMWTTTSGTLTTGTAGSWIACSTSPSWTRNIVGSGVAVVTGLVQIRHIASGTIVTSANITLQAEREV